MDRETRRIAIGVVLTSALAHIPGPVPTSQAILQAQRDPKFLAAEQSARPPGSTYCYAYYTDDPGWDLTCHGVGSIIPIIPIADWIHYLFPFHEYSTSTLVFSIVRTNNITGSELVGPLTLAAEVNPSTGQVVSVSYLSACG